MTKHYLLSQLEMEHGHRCLKVKVYDSNYIAKHRLSKKLTKNN